MNNRIMNWLLGFVSKRMSAEYVNKYQKNSDVFFNCLLVSCIGTLIAIGLFAFDGQPLWGSFLMYFLVLIFGALTRIYEKLADVINEAVKAQTAFSSAFGQLNDTGFDFTKVLSDPEFGKMVSEMKQQYTKNVAENDDFLKEIEKNLGGKF